jgi:predicted RNA-binding Zn ribbon-like protein
MQFEGKNKRLKMIEQTQAREFIFLGGQLCLDFANTAGDHASEQPLEYLQSYPDLLVWGKQAGIVTAEEAQRLQRAVREHPAQGAAVLQRAIVLREAIYHIFSALTSGTTPPAADLAILNTALEVAPVQLQVTAVEDGFICVWLADKAALDGLLGPVAWSAANLLASDEARRVKMCSGDECGWLFLDTTKNHSRRWCDMADCGSRAKARRYYQRKRART